MVGTPIPRNYGTEGSNSELSRRQNLRRFHTRWCMDRGKVEIGGPRDHVGPLELPEHQVPVRYNPDRNITPDEPRARFIVGEDRSTTLPHAIPADSGSVSANKNTCNFVFCRVLEDGGQRDDSCRYSEERERCC